MTQSVSAGETQAAQGQAGTIVVTATRRAESIERTPVRVAALAAKAGEPA
ncbi:hypothetical protein [Aurantiacibacter suaedae]|nr:hypothetical protein [Aurantiacibacter suaedae]